MTPFDPDLPEGKGWRTMAPARRRLLDPLEPIAGRESVLLRDALNRELFDDAGVRKARAGEHRGAGVPRSLSDADCFIAPTQNQRSVAAGDLCPGKCSGDRTSRDGVRWTTGN